MKLLELNDGWTQIPPKKDGEYWMANARPWHSENAHNPDCFLLVRIKDGKLMEAMSRHVEKWISPDAQGGPVWNSESQDELLAAWRPKRDGESFNNLPPVVNGSIFERRPATCSICGKLAATYRVWRENGSGETIYDCPRLCFSCGHVEMMDKKYFSRNFGNALIQALKKDTGAIQIAATN